VKFIRRSCTKTQECTVEIYGSKTYTAKVGTKYLIIYDIIEGNGTKTIQEHQIRTKYYVRQITIPCGVVVISSI